MPYITFSKNLKGQIKLKSIVEKSAFSKNSIVALRGTSTVGAVVKKAAKLGFNTVLIIDKLGKATEIKIADKDGKGWKHGNTIKAVFK